MYLCIYVSMYLCMYLFVPRPADRSSAHKSSPPGVAQQKFHLVLSPHPTPRHPFGEQRAPTKEKREGVRGSDGVKGRVCGCVQERAYEVKTVYVCVCVREECIKVVGKRKKYNYKGCFFEVKSTAQRISCLHTLRAYPQFAVCRELRSKNKAHRPRVHLDCASTYATTGRILLLLWM